MLENRTAETVRAGIPAFTTEYARELSRTLAEMGILDAFDLESAVFSGIAAREKMLRTQSLFHHSKFMDRIKQE